MSQLMTLESMTVFGVVMVHDPVYADIVLAAAFGPVLFAPGKQPPLPSGPPGVFAPPEHAGAAVLPPPEELAGLPVPEVPPPLLTVELCAGVLGVVGFGAWAAVVGLSVCF